MNMNIWFAEYRTIYYSPSVRALQGFGWRQLAQRVQPSAIIEMGDL